MNESTSNQEPCLGVFISNQEQFDLQKSGTRIQFYCSQCNDLCSIKISCGIPVRAKQRRLLCKSCGSKMTCMENYGVDNPNKSKEVRSKIKETCLIRYGVEYPGQAEITKQHIKESNLKKYGVECSFQSETVKNKIKETLIERYGVEYSQQSKQIQETTKRNNLAKYGTESVMRVEDFKTKQKQSCIEKYGVENVFQSEQIKNKIKQSNLERHGVEYPMQSEDIREKSRQTCIEHYGVPHVSMCKDIIEKSINTKIKRYGTCSVKYNYIYDGVKFDSSWELVFYTYKKDVGKNIIRSNKRIEYYYGSELHYYEPDFEIDGVLYEVKGSQFMKDGELINPFDKELNSLAEAKLKCCKANNVVFVLEKEIMYMMNYVLSKYGNDFIEKCKVHN